MESINTDHRSHATSVRAAPPVAQAFDDPKAATLLTELLQLTETSGGKEFSTPAGCVDELLFTLEGHGAQVLVIRRRFPFEESVSELPSLSPRELAIARLVAKGLPNKSIGHLLEISPWTVATHLRRIFTKLQVASRAAMVARLTRLRLL